MVAKLQVVAPEVAPNASLQRFRPGLVMRSDGASLRYIEEKSANMVKVAELLQESEAANHWANFGPVSRHIESEIAQMLKLDDKFKVVMCSSGTAALHGIVSLHETIAGKSLRWLTSSFGYYSSIQGPLQNAEIVDCDANAMLNLEGLDPKDFDGFVVTNVFGQVDRLDEYYRYAATHGKIVVVDAAMAFGSHVHGANECISFHHTKPWGFGEAGCALVAAEHENLFRSLICFGHETGQEINRRASNGKISDVACAFGLVRLREMAQRGAEYREQYRRIAKLGRAVGFEILSNVAAHPGIPASVPFVAPTAFENFKHPVLPTGRYYHPLADTPQAFDLYRRIVNVPCHPGLASLSDEMIENALRELISRCP